MEIINLDNTPLNERWKREMRERQDMILRVQLAHREIPIEQFIAMMQADINILLRYMSLLLEERAKAPE